MLPFLASPQEMLVKVLNALLDREDWAKQKSRVHAGKNIQVVVSSWQIVGVIMPDGRVAVANEDAIPHVKLTLTQEALQALPHAIKRKMSVDELASFLHIEGDAGLAQLVSEWVRDLRWDVEDELSRLLGPFMASAIVMGARDLKAKSKQWAEKGVEQAKERLKGEPHVLVPREVMAAFKQDAQALLTRVEQLEQQLAKGRGSE